MSTRTNDSNFNASSPTGATFTPPLTNSPPTDPDPNVPPISTSNNANDIDLAATMDTNHRDNTAASSTGPSGIDGIEEINDEGPTPPVTMTEAAAIIVAKQRRGAPGVEHDGIHDTAPTPYAEAPDVDDEPGKSLGNTSRNNRVHHDVEDGGARPFDSDKFEDIEEGKEEEKEEIYNNEDQEDDNAQDSDEEEEEVNVERPRNEVVVLPTRAPPRSMLPNNNDQRSMIELEATLVPNEPVYDLEPVPAWYMEEKARRFIAFVSIMFIAAVVVISVLLTTTEVVTVEKEVVFWASDAPSMSLSTIPSDAPSAPPITCFNNKDASDAEDHQGRQLYRHPTDSPTLAPTTAPPTRSPTSHPTLHGQAFMLRGIMWYDRNANGVRDSNVEVTGVGTDVEFSHGVGGIRAQLVQCDENSGKAYVAAEGETLENYASAITQGFDNRMVPQVIPANDQNGKYNLFVNGLEKWYLVEVEAPNQYLFTAGICNDDIPGWECNYDPTATTSTRRRIQADDADDADDDNAVAVDTSRGISTGRSTSCVYVNKLGEVLKPDENNELKMSSINFGVMRIGDMRIGDSQGVTTSVALVLQFDGDSGPSNPELRRLLSDALARATPLDEEDDGAGTITTRYLLGEVDKAAIATVTAEVLAVSLDMRLAKDGVSLDAVAPKEVILSSARPSGDASSTGGAADGGAASQQLAVAMDIMGHYSPPPHIDFDYIVQDSINKDTATIRRGLREYNSNCRDQNNKVKDEGLREKDFAAVVSAKGASGRGRNQDVAYGDDVFSTACSSGFLAPDYFETDLKEIQALKVSEVEFKQKVGNVVYIAEEDAGGLQSWAMGPVAGIAGLILLLLGVLVFRRALGPRRVDKYSDAVRRTGNVDSEEMRRFGEAGGAMDDGSVDSAFYSDSDGDEEETDKERRMRRKRKEKSDDQYQRKSKSSSGAKAGKKKGSSGNKKSRDKKDVEKKLTVSQGSDDTESLGKVSNDSEEVAAEKSGRREKKRSPKDRSEKEKKPRSSSRRRDADSSDRRRKEKRSRSKRRGGGNAKAEEEVELV